MPPLLSNRAQVSGAIPFPFGCDYLVSNQEAFIEAPQVHATELQGNRQLTRFLFDLWLYAARTRHVTADRCPRTTRWTIGQCGHSGLRRASNTQE